ncbi:MAG: lysophospholipase [Proteobacteria bacterium]|nr:lysophospholipase [Pseudomonadota bacterium]
MTAVRTLVLLAAMLGACAPTIRAPGDAINQPLLTGNGVHTADGEILPVKIWAPEQGAPKAVIIALHGFNDYSNFFAAPGAFLAKHRVQSYAYDQRGFGAAPAPGVWAGTDAMTDDLRTMIRLVQGRHPQTPLYLLGDSMGGAVILVAGGAGDLTGIDGVILAAPAVWGRITMPWYQRLGLWIGAHLMPSLTLTGEGLKIKPSDNIEMLLALGRDPLVIKATRIDAMHGLVNLMDAALDKAAGFKTPALILYGERDEIIPRQPTRMMLARMPEDARRSRRIALYKDGYHMLLRDLKAEVAWRDILGWIADPDTPLASGADTDAEPRLAGKGEAGNEHR